MGFSQVLSRPFTILAENYFCTATYGTFRPQLGTYKRVLRPVRQQEKGGLRQGWWSRHEPAQEPIC